MLTLSSMRKRTKLAGMKDKANITQMETSTSTEVAILSKKEDVVRGGREERSQESKAVKIMERDQEPVVVLPLLGGGEYTMHHTGGVGLVAQRQRASCRNQEREQVPPACPPLHMAPKWSVCGPWEGWRVGQVVLEAAICGPDEESVGSTIARSFSNIFYPREKWLRLMIPV